MIVYNRKTDCRTHGIEISDEYTKLRLKIPRGHIFQNIKIWFFRFFCRVIFLDRYNHDTIIAVHGTVIWDT